MAKNDFCDKYFEYYLQVNGVGHMDRNITIEYEVYARIVWAEKAKHGNSVCCHDT
ncbi:hypothetical protein I3S_26175 [Escherichia coli O121 str. RM8352]|nr:hypothetical protein I3S_26175 [Escherichia coli O121 str. RM8352]